MAHGQVDIGQKYWGRRRPRELFGEVTWLGGALGIGILWGVTASSPENGEGAGSAGVVRRLGVDP